MSVFATIKHERAGTRSEPDWNCRICRRHSSQMFSRDKPESGLCRRCEQLIRAGIVEESKECENLIP